MKQKILGIILVLTMIICMPLSALADGFPRESLDSVAVVYSELYYDGELAGYGWGTGFFVGAESEDPEYIVTNYHVVEDYLDFGGPDQGNRIYIVYNQNSLEEGYLVDYNEQMDVALLRVGKPCTQRKPLSIEIPTNDMVGEPVYAVGYPAISEATNPVSKFSKEDATVTSGNVSRLTVQSGTGRRIIQTDTVINSGNSGGPLLDENGNAIGLTTFEYVDESGSSVPGSSFAVSVEELIPLLNRNHVDYYTKTDSGTVSSESLDNNESGANSDNNYNSDNSVMPDSNNNVNEPVTIAPPTEPQTETAPVSAPVETSSEPDSNTNIILFAVIIVVLIVAAILLVLLLKSKKAPTSSVSGTSVNNENNITRPIPQPIPQPKKSNAVIRSLAAQHMGKTVPVGSTPIVIGRDNSCQLIYMPETRGVSRRHCTVQFVESTKEFIVTDLNSSYGTYLVSGFRLPANVPYRLKAGDSFYLGDPENTLKPEME